MYPQAARAVPRVAWNIAKTLPGGLIAWWDGVAESIYGYKAHEIVGKPLSVLVPPDRFDELSWIMERIEKGKSIDSYETVRRRKNGTSVRVSMSVFPVCDGAGRVIGAAAKLRELGSAEPEQQTIGEILRVYRELMEKVPFGVLCLDLAGKLHYANRAAATLSGYPSVEALLQQPLKNLPYVPSRDSGRLASRREFEEGFRGREIEWAKCDGSRIRVHLESRPLLDNSGETLGYAVFVEEKEERKQEQEGAGQSQEMEALGRLASGIAHDFNNVLGVILGYAQLVQRASSEDKKQANLAQIFKAGQQAKLLTRQLQAFGHRRAAALRAMDLNEEVRHLSEILQVAMEPKIDVAMNLEPGPCQIQADPTLIDQVVMDLAANAREAMPDGGRLTLETSIVAHSSGTPLPPGSYVRLSLSDTGRGLDANEKDHIFEPFFFTDEGRGKKNGLRLATVYGMVKQNGGYILVDGKRGCGTTFTMYFPRTE